MNSGGRRLALLIGVEHYRSSALTNLPSASADVRELGRVLADPGIGRFDEVVDDVGPAADSESIRVRIEEFLRRCQPSDFVVLYISGHGERARRTDGELHFLASDSDPTRLADASVPASFINEQLEACRARQKVAIFDCCMSGGYALGLRTRDAKSAAPQDQRGQDGLIDTEGVYIMCSSRLSESSFAGKTENEPSQFTGALVKGLKTGEADANMDGIVDMDELFSYVSDRMRTLDADTRQNPTKSALQVSGELVLAYTARRRRRPRPQDQRSGPAELAGRTQPSGTVAAGSPSWPTLIEYYRQAVLAEKTETRLLDARPGAGGYVCVPGPERLLSGSLDEEAGIPAPVEAAGLITAARSAHKDLVYGYPVVVLHQSGGERRPQFAPLLVRQIKIVETSSGIRLEPYGAAQVNPALAQELLEPDQALQVAASYRPTWLAGGLREMARDIRFLLTDAFELAEVEPLRPEALCAAIDVATPTDGARNAAVLMQAPDDGMTARLLKDLGAIAAKHKDIPHTALGALLDGRVAGAPTTSVPLPVTIGQANEAQLAVLSEALSSRVTVATGPPGTGKSELIANLAATAVAAGLSVLVASTNNQAVDEVWHRCEARVPGLIVRTGNRDYRPKERESLAALLALASCARSSSTTTHAAAHARAVRQAVEARLACTAKATWEQHMLEQGRARAKAEASFRELGAQRPTLIDTSEVAELEHVTSKATKAANARFLGRRRRRRLLEHAGVLVKSELHAEACRRLAALAAAEHGWRLRKDEAHRDDAALATAVEQSEADARDTSLALMADQVADGARSGQRLIHELLFALQSGPGNRQGRNEWSIYRELLPKVRGWAVSALSARNFPLDAGLFDLVIIDEASQCSLAATLPLLFRAKAALIIGDPMQLRHIAGLRPDQDGAVAELCGIDPAWLAERKLTHTRHSTFDAWEALRGSSLLLDEHYRCHPHIAAIADAMFYAPRGQRLTVLTDVARLRPIPGPDRPRIAWDPLAAGKAEPGPGRKSWINRAEAAHAVRRAEWLLGALPPDATVGIVTPFRPQANLIKALLGQNAARVRVGTVHTFQGGECDAMIFSLVATESMEPGGRRFFDRDENLWNVAITRAKAMLLVIGDRAFWDRHGALGGKLAARIDAVREHASRWRHPDDVRDLLYDRLTGIGAKDLELGVSAGGYAVDARFTVDDARPLGIILDLDHPEQPSGGKILRQQVKRAGLISAADTALTVRRLPGWLLYASDEELIEAIRVEPVGRKPAWMSSVATGS